MECTEYESMFNLEDRHWYFAGKRALVMALLGEHFPASGGGLILDAGCGTGRTLAELKFLGDAVGIEPFANAISLAARRGAFTLVQGDLENLPFRDESFAAVTLLDVLEHCDDDVLALRAVARALKPGATAVITVPAYQWLWSSHDEALHHRRRYSRRQLEALLATCGFHLCKISYFNMFVFPLIAALRLVSRLRCPDKLHADTDSLPPGVVNGFLNSLQWFERVLISRFSLSFGVSLVCVAKKCDESVFSVMKKPEV